jgi:hypothetical protein
LRIVNEKQGYEDVPEPKVENPVEESADSTPPKSTVPVRGTFVHFKRAAGSLRKSGSEPCLESVETPAAMFDDFKAEIGSQSDSRSTAASSDEALEVMVLEDALY